MLQNTLARTGFVSLSLVALACSPGKAANGARSPLMHLAGIGPRLISNQTSQPIAVYGSGLRAGARLHLGPPFSRDFPIAIWDESHGFARIDGLAIPAELIEQTISVSLVADETQPADGEAPLTIVNDGSFPDLLALTCSADGRLAFALSTTTDELFAADLATGKVTVIPTADGPAALANWVEADGREWIAVAHRYSPELHLVRVSGGGFERRVLPAFAYANGLAIDQQSGVAYVAEHALDTVAALKLSEEGRLLWRSRARPNPRSIAIAGDYLAVASLQTGEVELFDRKTGKALEAIAPRPGTSIVGGRTERYAKYVMGGKAPRDLAFSPALQRLFVSSIGPNIGPNPDRWEISGNGGVGVVDLRARQFVRHLGFGSGVPEGLALDDRAGLLYVADIATGLIRVLDAKKLAASSETSRKALIQQLAIPPLAGFPTARPPEDYGVQGRAGIELHSGPKALALTPDRSNLLVLNRFTGALALVDVRHADRGQASLKQQLALTDTLSQPKRRIGQILYFADFGRSGMSCDSCHLEGHTEGVFFEKTHPLRIYRATTVRGSRFTPPYFTPASTFSLAQTALMVGNRNRLHNPDLLPDEVSALTIYAETVSTLANPFAGSNGAPPNEIELPDGPSGSPYRGMQLFGGKAGCTPCHPPPLFAADQDPSTRGRYANVATPAALPLRLEMQNLLNKGFAAPSLIGCWDIFPMLTSGAAGFDVRPDGSLGVSSRFPLRAVIEMYGKPPHGNAASLSLNERNDLLAYLLSL